MKNPGVPIYNSELTWGKMFWPKIVAIVAIVGSICTVICTMSGSRQNTQGTLLILAGAWAMLAPIWFFAEYHYFYRRAPGIPVDDTWELFKHGQQVAVSIWAGATVALYALGSSDLAKPKGKEIECTFYLPALPSTAASAVMLLAKCPK